jgi:hypothetical protein
MMSNTSVLVLDKGRVNAGVLSQIPLLGILQSGVVRYHAEPFGEAESRCAIRHPAVPPKQRFGLVELMTLGQGELVNPRYNVALLNISREDSG